MTNSDQQFIQAVEKHLKEGWSVTVAVKKAGLSAKEYKALKEMYPEFKELVLENYQHGRPGWVK